MGQALINMHFLRCTLSATCVLFMLACNRTHNTNQTKNHIIEKFPIIETIDDASTQLDIGAIGILDFRVVDSLLLVSTQAKTDLWQIYKLPTNEHIKSIFNIGAGPHEISSPVPFLYTSIYRDHHGNCHISFFEKPTKRLISIDLSRINEQNERSFMTETYNQPVSTLDLYSFLMPNGNIYNIRPDFENLRINRSVFQGMDDITYKSLVSINNKQVVDDISQLGSIMTFPLFSPDGRYIADISMNGSISLIDITQDSAISLTHSKSILDDSDTISPVQAFENYFTIIKTNNEIHKSSVEFISWSGEPLLELILPNNHTSFIYINKGILYTLDSETETIFSYNIHNVMNTLNEYKP